MRVLMDANVLFPTVMREVLLGAAAGGAFQPLWSARILEEWARATRKLGDGAEGIARAEIALIRDRWPQAEVASDPRDERDLHLPDDNDLHVLAAAISGKADTLLTRNLKDFPTRVLTPLGLVRREPDGFLMEIAAENEAMMRDVVREVGARAEAASGRPPPVRALRT
ncbi:MAG: RSP_2648 family PIN domain-containing protein, partial [Paracoccaceae bacterium]